ncbi:MAG: 3-phosphoshikimate 1-carboxyvinyltransferase [Treponemataceae bacterium]
MKIKIFKSSLNGCFEVPPSKSHSIRAVVLSCFAKNVSELKNVLNSEDVQTALNIFEELGCEFEIVKKTKASMDLRVMPPKEGLVAHIEKSQKKIFLINCENSGTLLYFLAVIFSFCKKTFLFDGDASLQKRPLTQLVELYQKRKLSFQTNAGFLPLKLEGHHCDKFLNLNLDGKFSQCISGLFLATAIFGFSLELSLANFGEAPYVNMTRSWLESLGFEFEIFSADKKFFKLDAREKKLNAFSKTILSDWSAVAFPILAALSTKSALTIKALADRTQGDMKILDFLTLFNIAFNYDSEYIRIAEKQSLTAAKIDIGETPDLLPVVFAIASLAQGNSIIVNGEIARYKETDRIKTSISELKKFGAKFEEREGHIVALGYDNLTSSDKNLREKVDNKTSYINKTICVDSFGDHRIAMMLISFALGQKNTSIVNNYECYKISFPSFLEELKKCNGKFCACSK